MHISAKMLREADEEGQLPVLASILTDIHLQDLARLDRNVNRFAGNPMSKNGALPLTDDGEEFARVEANVPAALAMEFQNRKGWGPETFSTDAGMKEFLRCYPQFKVKTVSGKIQSGWRGESRDGREGGEGRKRSGAVFGRGTMNYAK